MNSAVIGLVIANGLQSGAAAMPPVDDPYSNA